MIGYVRVSTDDQEPCLQLEGREEVFQDTASGHAPQLAPHNAHNAYVYAVALNSTGRGDEALKVLAGSS